MKEFNPNYLDFEQPLLEIEGKIKQLNNDPEKTAKSDAAIIKLDKEYQELTKKIFNNLSDWQISQLARHPLRPYTLDYIPNIFSSFNELHGDRMFGDDPAIVSGIAKIDNFNFMFIGHQKGRDAKEKVKRNFGMPKPEGYRKALRIMKLAEKFHLPIVTFIDTPGAYPGIDAESRNQSQAIAENLFVMSNLRVPVISIIIGEGGSGGALAIGVCDKLGMLENSIYSVISPEGCASILWKDPKKAEQAADALCITASKLLEFNLIDIIVPEPLGGAHRDHSAMSSSLKMNLISLLEELSNASIDELLHKRKQKIESYGKFETS
ncbi:MAG: Acetyl-coenzyme A carboxylase carboxyl transferase subunit alpha [Gammaproteobacteria bacterium]|nr:MAG: acetyl-CoA carboxylase carboxyl transferase subunit alpha [Gammaproteobacteria bacterium TMED257]CAI8309726.1 MAG: Acetyl-coenzyme A carboxylase carboxyl transferase subunit alpha [Gammaproteobacteria bacterium]|tara:strand:- start:3418 stop:4383 length:966 start_codon:yes stop_codon:yes gene_type:complete